VQVGCLLGARSNSFRAELFAIALCLYAFWTRFRGAPPAVLLLFADSRAALDSLAGAARPTAHVALVNAVLRLLEWLHADGHIVVLHWVPGHADIPEHDAVDAEAKAAALRPAVGFGACVAARLRTDYSAVRAAITAATSARWATLWTRLPAGQHLRRLIPAPVRTAELWTGPRARDRTLCWLRLGTCLNEFLHRVYPREVQTPHCPFAQCGGVETVQHYLLSCVGYSAHRPALIHDVQALLPTRPVTAEVLLGTAAPVDLRQPIGDAVMRFVVASGRFLLNPQ
jgi:ribonuclease HI